MTGRIAIQEQQFHTLCIERDLPITTEALKKALKSFWTFVNWLFPSSPIVHLLISEWSYKHNKQGTLPSNCALHSCNSSGPAARWILSLNTPLLLRDSFVVFTIAMVFSLVISPDLQQDI